MRALIGHTGFVGGTLARSSSFDRTYNSSNIEEIAGNEFELVVCAGVRAEKWLANRDPENDRASIDRLTRCLGRVETKRFILISTVDVYGDPSAVTEADAPVAAGLHPYGLHRLQLEQFVADRFKTHHIVRLPALFGTGLKKNVIFDLLNGNLLERISPRGSFQWYPMARLAEDLERVVAAEVSLLNFAVEPIPTREIHRRFFPHLAIGGEDLPAGSYDVWTRHPAVLLGDGHYHLRREAVFDELSKFVATYRKVER